MPLPTWQQSKSPIKTQRLFSNLWVTSQTFCLLVYGADCAMDARKHSKGNLGVAGIFGRTVGCKGWQTCQYLVEIGCRGPASPVILEAAGWGGGGKKEEGAGNGTERKSRAGSNLLAEECSQYLFNIWKSSRHRCAQLHWKRQRLVHNHRPWVQSVHEMTEKRPRWDRHWHTDDKVQDKSI